MENIENSQDKSRYVKERNKIVLNALNKREKNITENKDLSNDEKKALLSEDSNTFKEKAIQYMMDQIQQSYIGKETDEDVLKREYLSNFISCIWLEHNKNYKNTDIEIEGRFKSEDSFFNKALYRAFKEEHNKKITDMMGIKILIKGSKEAFPSNSYLAIEREKNKKIFNELVEFRDLIQANKYELPKKEYYENMIKLLQALQNVVPSKANELKADFKKKENVIHQKLEYLPIAINDKMSEKDYHMHYDNFNLSNDTDKTDFEILLDDFNERIDDSINYQLLVNQITTMFKTDLSPRLKQFDYKIIEDRNKENSNGYVAKFIIIDTLAGPIEIQLQTEHQRNEGRDGFASHAGYKHNPPPEKLPNFDDPEEIENFVTKVEPTLPAFFEVRRDPTSYEPTVNIVTNDFYSRLKISTQVKKGDPLEDIIKEYWMNIYKNRKKIFENNKNNSTQVESFQNDDIDFYLESDDFKKLKDLHNKEISSQTNNNNDIDHDDR